MKNLLILLLLFLISATGLRAGDFTGAGSAIRDVLNANNMTVRELQLQGLKIGEVTGAGRRVLVENVVHYITDNSVVPSGRISHISYKRNTLGKKVSEIESIEYNGRRISARRLKGIVYQR